MCATLFLKRNKYDCNYNVLPLIPGNVFVRKFLGIKNNFAYLCMGKHTVKLIDNNIN